jgi:hypothetical protein
MRLGSFTRRPAEENWIPLFDDSGAPFFPVLMAELDAVKKKRIGGLMLRRDWGQHAPWPTWPKEDEIDLTHMSRKVKEVIRAAGLRDELTFTSFRHGGFTEAGDAELTDRELMAQGRHKSPRCLASTSSGPRAKLLRASGSATPREQMADRCRNEHRQACRNGRENE